MGKKLYRQETSGEIHTLNPQSHYVTLPTSTIDLWMPLIGAVGVGVYALYCRLAREGRVRGLDLKRMAKAARVSDNTLRSLNRTLERIGFIRVEKPEGAQRLRHYTTEIRLLEPPTSVPLELIRELECQSGYEILAHWLVESGETAMTPSQIPELSSVDEGAPSDAPVSVPPVVLQPPQAPQSASLSISSSAIEPEQAPMNVPQRALERPKLPWETPVRAVQHPQTPISPSPRGAEGPVALSSVIENVWQRQITLMNAPHSAAQRELTLQRPSGVAPERSVEAPTDATLESLSIESLRGMEESPLPLIPKRLNTPTSPRLPWNDSQIRGRTAQPAAPTRSSPSPSGTDVSKADLPPRGTR